MFSALLSATLLVTGCSTEEAGVNETGIESVDTGISTSETGTDTSETDTTTGDLPESPTVTIDPNPAFTLDNLTALVNGGVDPKGDGVTYSYEWFVDGELSSGNASSTVSSTETTKNETWSVEVTPTSMEGVVGEAVTASVTISNSAPSLPSISLDPDPPRAGLDNIVCVIDVESEDADEDTINYSFIWRENGASWMGGLLTTFNHGDTLEGKETTAGSTYECEVMGSDGSGGAVTVVVSTVAVEP